jgi:methyltransferase-like protein/SAM-dependent methyltransferase
MAPLTSPTSYDDVPYDSHSYPQSHPARLATVAALFGLSPPPLDGCRVLEMGCASGGNLLPLALAYPDSRFVGVERSARQSALGRLLATELGLTNVEIRHGDILGISEADGLFDYIVCHGVYSWVPRPVQEAILAVCARNLRPGGVAYVSYNTYPGWKQLGMLRDMMLFHARRFPTPGQQVSQARGLLDFLSKWVPEQDDPYGLLLKKTTEGLRGKSDNYLYHDHLEEVNEPVYFHQFMERADAAGLQFLGEADLGLMATDGLPEELREKLAEVAPNTLMQEQYLDFLRNRSFRQTLLVHKGQPVNRKLSPASLVAMHLTMSARPEKNQLDLARREKVEFKGPGGRSVTASEPLVKSFLAALVRAWPGSVPFADAYEQAHLLLGLPLPAAGLAGALARQERAAVELSRLVYLGAARRVIELSLGPPRFALVAGEKPLASPLARIQAREATRVTNLRHETVTLSDFDRQLLPLLDGTRGRAELLAGVTALVRQGALVPREGGTPVTDPARQQTMLQAFLERSLRQLAQLALLLG